MILIALTLTVHSGLVEHAVICAERDPIFGEYSFESTENIPELFDYDEFNYEVNQKLLQEKNAAVSRIIAFIRNTLWQAIVTIAELFGTSWHNARDHHEIAPDQRMESFDSELASQEVLETVEDFEVPNRENILGTPTKIGARSSDQLNELYHAWKNLPFVAKLITAPIFMFYAWVKIDTIAWAIWKFPRLPSQAYEEETQPSTYEFVQMKQFDTPSDDESNFRYGTPHSEVFTPYRPVSRHPPDEPWYGAF
ncbi:TetR [Perkinsela sp. CCAP 1560/4]|nr:TetR [Perkinsela sp. CCAP 1560/4]|eukprot:KNH08452.1 TetR [Perkinsela sp. CCAP 1560/4]